jgi:hypothetical protein
MIPFTTQRVLTLSQASSPGRHAHLSAASGLVNAGAFWYVVADDELHLGVFPVHGQAPGELMRLFPGTLPNAAAERKQHKPDLETLVRLPPFAGCPGGALLCLPSGSEPNRCTAALLALAADGSVIGTPRRLDLAGLFAGLTREFPALNIEGATVSGETLLLLQRGGRQDPRNACIRYALPEVLRALAGADSLAGVAPSQIEFVELGEIAGVPLGFSDAATLPGVGLIFTAIAEDTGDTYMDGPCVGAALGIIDVNGGLRYLQHLAGAPKVEGIHAEMAGQLVQVWLVTDADDEVVAARLLAAEICIV